MIKINYSRSSLNEAVINKEEALDFAYEKLQKLLPSKEIERLVIKTLHKAKTFKDVENAVEAKVEAIKGDKMNFKENILKNLERKDQINEMAVKHLDGSKDAWETGDFEKVAEIYIKNAKADGKDEKDIIRSLGGTFRAKQFTDKPEDVIKVKAAIKKKVGPVDMRRNVAKIEDRPGYAELVDFIKNSNAEIASKILPLMKNINTAKKQIKKAIEMHNTKDDMKLSEKDFSFLNSVLEKIDELVGLKKKVNEDESEIDNKKIGESLIEKTIRKIQQLAE